MRSSVLKAVYVCAFLLSPFSIKAQAPPIQWQKTLGGSADELLFDIIQTSDGGYVVAGRSASGISGDKSEASRGGTSDIWIVKLDAAGNKLWDKTIGSAGNDHPANIVQTPDGGFIIGGYAGGSGGDRTAPQKGGAGIDYWMVKLDAAGTTVQWQTAYGGGTTNQGYSLIPARHGSFYMSGFSNSAISGDKTEASRGAFDIWVVKTDASGGVRWNKTIGGGDWEAGLISWMTTDGGLLTGGYSRSGISGEKTEANRGAAGTNDFWMVKTDSNGNVGWDKTLGGTGAEDLYVLQQTPDGGYIAGGPSGSGISGDKTEATRGANDYWFLKLDATRNISWQRTIGGTGEDALYTVTQTPDGGYLLGGASASGISGERDEASRGGNDYWIVKLNASGAIQWQKAYGGSSDDYLRMVRPTSDGGFILGGYSGSSISGEKTENARGGTDFWIIKLGPCDTTIQLADSFCTGDSYRLPGGNTVSVPGTYFDTLKNAAGCDSVIITALAYYQDDIRSRAFGILGADTTFCVGQSWTLNAAVGGAASYTWSTGAATPSITVTTGGMYWVDILSAKGCRGTDTIQILFNPVPVVDLGNDTGICSSQAPLILRSPQPPGTRYLWSNGLSDTTMAVIRTGSYWLEASIGNCRGSDTVMVTVVTDPVVYLGPDTIICEQSPLRVGTQIPGANYQWNTGASTSFIHVNTTGNYILEVNLYGCITADTIVITAMPEPAISLGPDKDICPGQQVVLDPGAGANSVFLWNDGTADPSYLAEQPGTYWVRVTSEYHCMATDSILLSPYPMPQVFLGPDTSVCEETPLLLKPVQVNADSLLWSDGNRGDRYSIVSGGMYIVTAINQCGSVSDTILVKQVFCDIWLPNAFTPNNDGTNDVFRVLGNVMRLEGFGLSIFNRWGQRIFHTQDKYGGWDGTQDGNVALLGTYVYLLEYNIDGQPYIQKGSFHLLR